MRYLRKFSGDDITLDDFLPSSHTMQVDIPELRKKSDATKLNDLPIRVKTRYNGQNGFPTRRVVSTPIFDLVTMDTLVDMIPPPKFRNEFTKRPYSSPGPVSTQENHTPESNPALISRHIKPPTEKYKSLPATPNVPKDHIQGYHHQQRLQHAQSRQVSMPVQLINTPEKLLHQVHDYTNIIQIYEENSPFGVFNSELTTAPSIKHLSTSPESADISSPEVNSTSSLSDTISNTSSDYSFVDGSEDFISSKPKSSAMHIEKSAPIEKTSESRTKLHPRDSIRYMRNYDNYHNQFEIKTKIPPVLPQHIENVVKKDAYYKSRASFDGERADPTLPAAPCNEHDTSIFTRMSRRLPKSPPKNTEPIRNISPNENIQQIQTFQMPGYTGGLRVVNSVPT